MKQAAQTPNPRGADCMGGNQAARAKCPEGHLHALARRRAAHRGHVPQPSYRKFLKQYRCHWLITSDIYTVCYHCKVEHL